MLYRTYILLTWRFSSTKLCLRPGLRVFQQPASMAWITLARCTRGTGAVRDRTNRAISSLSSWDSSRKRNFLGISSSHNLPTMGVVIPYLLAETTTKCLFYFCKMLHNMRFSSLRRRNPLLFNIALVLYLKPILPFPSHQVWSLSSLRCSLTLPEDLSIQ